MKKTFWAYLGGKPTGQIFQGTQEQWDAYADANGLQEGPEPHFPTYPTLAEAEAAMVEWIDSLTARVTGRYPKAERETWPHQEAAAHAFLESGDAAPADMLALLDVLSVGGLTREEVANGIVAKADAFREIVKTVLRLRRETSAALQAVDPAAPDDYEAVLAAAMQTAITEAQRLGLA